MKIELYQSFVAVADCRNITAAARDLHIAQPALSSQIKALEQHYGVELLIRLPRSVELTDAGRIFYQYCKNVLFMEENTRVDLARCSKGEAGVLKLGTTRSYPDEVIRKLLELYSAQHPAVHYELYESSSSALVDALDNGTIEFAAIRAAALLPSFVNEIISYHEHFRALCAKDSTLLPKDTDTIELTDLTQIPLSISYGLRSYIKERCENFGFQPVIHSMNPSRHSVLQWAEMDRAVALLPMSEDYYTVPVGLRCYKIKGNPLSSKRLFITKKGRKLSPAASRLVETLYTMFPPAV